MPVIPNLIERTIFLRLNEGPGPLLDLVGAQAFKAVAIAVKLGVFEALGKGPLKAAGVAQKIEVDERSVTTLLDVLDALGYVRKEDSGYENTAMTERWMLVDSPDCIADLFGYFDDMMKRWEYLDQSIRKGEPPLLGWEWFEQHPESWRKYHTGMRSIARLVANEIVSKVDVPPTARKLLDMGGSHGFYGISFCKKHPKLEAVILDWGQAREVAEETISAEGMSDRVSFKEADFVTDSIGDGYDIALLFNVIRIFKPDQAGEVFRKTAGALNKSGLIVVMDQLGAEMTTQFGKANARLINLELINSMKGRIYKKEKIIQLVKSAGFDSPRVIGLRRSPGFSLVIATKEP